MKQWFWPDIDSLADAKKVARNGAGVSFFVTTVTGVVTFLETNGYMKLFGYGPEAYLDALLFLIIGIGLCFYSRLAAIAGLGLYIFEQVVAIKSGVTGGSIMAIYITLVYINAVRATLDYHRLKKFEDPEAPAAAEAAAEGPPKKFPKKLVLLGVVIAAAAVGGWFFLSKKSPPAPRSGTSGAAQEEVALGDSKTFRMKSGDVIRGQVTMEDPEFFVVRHGGKEDVLTRKDIESVE